MDIPKEVEKKTFDSLNYKLDKSLPKGKNIKSNKSNER